MKTDWLKRNQFVQNGPCYYIFAFYLGAWHRQTTTGQTGANQFRIAMGELRAQRLASYDAGKLDHVWPLVFNSTHESCPLRLVRADYEGY